MPFQTEDGTEYYSYRVWIFLGIVVNSIMTYVTEILIIKYLTTSWDKKKTEKKQKSFLAQMEVYRAQPVSAEGGKDSREYPGLEEAHKPVATEDTVDVIR